MKNKIYAISCYIPFKNPNERICFYDGVFKEENGGYLAPIYGWSKSKELVQKFILTHKKELLRFKILEYDDDELSSFINFYRDLEIKYLEYSISYSKTVEILSTECERKKLCYNSSEFAETYVYDIGVDYSIFKWKYIFALDVLSYTTLFDLYIGGDTRYNSDEEISSRLEVASHNLSYNLTVHGNPATLITDTDFFNYWKLFEDFINTDELDILIQ